MKYAADCRVYRLTDFKQVRTFSTLTQLSPSNGMCCRPDRDKPVIYLDDRRGPGHDCMNRLGQSQVGLAGLYQVLSSKPNLNKATVYTSVMQVDDEIMQSSIRQCDDPCWFV